MFVINCPVLCRVQGWCCSTRTSCKPSGLCGSWVSSCLSCQAISQRIVLPVILMDSQAVLATYTEYWTPAVREAARSQGLRPATLADLRRLLSFQGIRQNQMQFRKAPLDEVFWSQLFTK